MKTYGEAVALLQTFLSASPDPDKIGTGSTPMDKLYRALITKSGSFGPPPEQPQPTPADKREEQQARAQGAMPPVELAVEWQNAEIFDKKNLGASWYQRVPEPAPESLPSQWTFDDSLDTASMLAFAIPEVGAVVAAAIGAFQHLLDNDDARQEMQARAMQARENLAKTITDELEHYMWKQGINDKLSLLISRVTTLKSHMQDMLVDPSRVTSAQHGFSSDWVSSPHEKEWVLGPEYLGAVWEVVESDAFISLTTESDDMPYQPEAMSFQDGPGYKLIEEPSLPMVTVDAYMQITGIVVNAVILYSLICLMPEAALRPGWDPESFDLASAVRSSSWRHKPNHQTGKSAYDCWETLYTYLDPNKSQSWIHRVDPETGDARKAFDAIKRRLDRISFGYNLSGQRPATQDSSSLYWFLAQDDPLRSVIFTLTPTPGWQLEQFHASDYPLEPSLLRENQDDREKDIFKSLCRDGQAEVKDTGLSTKQDTFADPYRNFKDSLSVADTSPGSNPLPSIRSSPWNGTDNDGAAAGSYDQLCWRPDSPRLFPALVNGQSADDAPPLLSDPAMFVTPPKKYTPDATWSYGWLKPIGFMDDPTGRDVIGWMGYVLSVYTSNFNYKVDVEKNVSTFSVAKLFYDAWIAVRQKAAELLDAGAEAKAFSQNRG